MVIAAPPVHISYLDAIGATDLRLLTHEMELSIASSARRRMSIPSRAVMFSENQESTFVSMPAYSCSEQLFVTKVGAIVTPGNGPTSSTVNAILVAYSGKTGSLIATIDGAAVTNMKCAAISALVTNLCTHIGPQSVAIIGAGVQAHQQFLAIRSVREIRELRLYSRSERRRDEFYRTLVRLGFDQTQITICPSADEASSGASIIATTTNSHFPIGHFANLSPNVHINCMGGHTIFSREVPKKILEESLLIVEDRQTAVDEAGEVHKSALEIEDLLERGDARCGPTIFSSTGHAFYDYCAARHILKARGLF